MTSLTSFAVVCWRPPFLINLDTCPRICTRHTWMNWNRRINTHIYLHTVRTHGHTHRYIRMYGHKYLHIYARHFGCLVTSHVNGLHPGIVLLNKSSYNWPKTKISCGQNSYDKTLQYLYDVWTYNFTKHLCLNFSKVSHKIISEPGFSLVYKNGALNTRSWQTLSWSPMFCRDIVTFMLRWWQFTLRKHLLWKIVFG